MFIAALSLWTAVPLGWIYIGSKLCQTQFPTAVPYAVVAAGVTASILIITWLIGRLNGLYVSITDTSSMAPVRPPWLNSIGDTSSTVGPTTVIEAVLMSSALIAALALMVWFFLLANSPPPSPGP
jgi:hypothetical protein